MKKAVFLDRDGTINAERHYLHKIEEFEFLPGVIDGLNLLQDVGFILVIVTNQSGIGRGYYTEDDFHKLNDWMLNELKKNGVVISKVYYCPHLPDAQIEKYRIDCKCRKPKLGMYEVAVKELDIDLNQSWAIGDKIRDLAICEKTGCRGFLVGNNEKTETINYIKNSTDKKIRYADDLWKVANIIAEE